MKNDAVTLLQKNIEQLDLSHSAMHFFKANRLHTLQDLLKIPMEEWFSFTGFSQHLLNEMMNFFEERSLSEWVIE